MANLCSWLFLLGPAPFAFCFASLLDGETHIWLGDLRFAFCLVVFVFCSVFDLPCYMTTGVNVDFISNCFFTCKDRALERDRPYQRKKNGFRIVPLLLHGSQITVWHFCGFVVPLLFSFAIPIPEVIQCYHLILYVSDACELIS